MRIAGIALAALGISVAAGAQPSADSPALAPIRHSLALEIQSEGGQRPSLARDIDYIALVARPTGLLLRTLQIYTEDRADKQVGSTSSAPGTTTLVSKGTVPKVLAMAVENGAVSRTESGTTATFRTNLGGAVRALAGQGFFRLSPENDMALRILDRLSASASFDTSRGNTASTLTADRQQLSQWTARLQVINQRDPQGSGALARWRARLMPLQVTIARDTVRLSQAFEADPAVQAWLTETATLVGAARAGGDVEAALKSREASFPASLQADTIEALYDYERSASAFVAERDVVLQGLAAGALVSLEYTGDRPVKAPRTSNVRLIGEVGGTVDLTGNVSMTFFDQNPIGVSSSVRDVQASGEMAIKMGSAETVGAFVFSVAGKYVHQLENSFSDDGIMLPNTKGTIVVGQFKLLVPVKGSGARIPVSVTFANRTELIKESIVRANVGISYDLDTIFARFRP